MNNRKTMALALAAVMAAAMAGCAKNADNQATGASSPSASQAPAAVSGAQALYASGKPLELKVHMHYGDIHVFKDEWPVFKKAAELTNVTLKGTAPQNATNSNEVFNLMLVSKDLPDIIQGDKANLLKASGDGALIPLDDLIEKNAPHIKKFFDDNPWVRQGAAAADGKLYYLPFVMDGKAAEGFFIRKDWLDKLGLKEPKTVDEYHQVLKMFLEKDPNGNNKQDEVPYFSRDKKGILDLVQLFGARTGWYEQDGQLRYGKYEAEYKTAMSSLSVWYKEKLIDNEIFTRGDKARDILLGDNVGGSTHDWFGSSSNYNDTLKDKVSGLQFLPIAPPADVNGKVKEESGRELLQPYGWGISSVNKHTVETIKYMDFWYTETGKRLGNVGIEGQQYTMQNGKAVYTDAVLKGKDPVNKQMWDIGAQQYIGLQMDYSYEEQWTNPVAAKGIREYLDNGYILPQVPSLSFNDAEQKILTEKWPAIETYIAEMEQKWIMGAQPVGSSFDSYVSNLKTMGIDSVIQVYNAAFKRYNGK
ncbi:MAG: sugar transporter permease [Paenibacillaceae bacterium]|jgi:putative aldouronate transport system substrate-binding protein|nr:sugar transporter permease [Paenibacillaceae bacterium]